MRKMWIVAAIVLMACSSNIEPGLLKTNIEKSESQRVYQTCMQNQKGGNIGALRRHCKKLYLLTLANYAWEDCVNEGILYCGSRPVYEDIK